MPLNMRFQNNILFPCLIFLLLILYESAYAQNRKSELVILNWSEYMIPEMIQAFEKQYDAKVKEVYFESDDGRDQILLQTQGEGFDLLMVNGASIRKYNKRGWLEPIETDKLTNYRYLEERWLKAFDSADSYGVPYFWGTLGIAYRKDLVKEPITSWKQFFEPAGEIKGKISLVRSSVDIIGMALKSLGYSANSEDIKELEEAETLLLKQKPYVASYGYITLEKNSALVNGDLVAAMVYGGDALNVAEHHDQITYVLPVEGGNIWVDYFAISSKSKNYELALKFLDFINQPEWAARNAEELYLATANSEAKKLLSQEFLEDNVIFPYDELLVNSEFYTVLSPRAERRRSLIFTRVVEQE